MPIHIEWHNEEKKVLIRTVEGYWTWKQWYDTRDEADSMMATVNHPVITVIDFTSSLGLPPRALGQVRTLLLNPPDNLDVTIIVGMGVFIQSIYNVGKKMYPSLTEKRRMILAPSMEKAQAIIEERLKQREESTDNEPT